jgi:hypothetical protein
MLIKGDGDSGATRQEWQAAGRRQIEEMHARSAELEASKPIVDMARECNRLFLKHQIDVWTLQSSSHSDWAQIRGNDAVVAERYETLRAREQLDQEIATSLNNAEFGRKPKLGERLIPALRDVIRWRRENPVCGKADDELAIELETAVNKAEAMNFVQLAIARAEKLAGQSWTR